MPVLDVDPRQVLVDYFDDTNQFRWHRRVLAVPLGGMRWVWATPDLEAQAADLVGHRVTGP
eukprot:8437582-Lingulodinium_polyedra.AAC.1